MDANASEINSEIKKKIQMLVAAYERIKQENEVLSHKKQELENQLKNKEQVVAELEERCSRLKLAHALKGDDSEMHDAKIKVNRIVREIDRCIALLNK